jgi:hypothetical protein
VESGLVETLLQSFALGDDKLTEGASVWLTRLSNEPGTIILYAYFNEWKMPEREC